MRMAAIMPMRRQISEPHSRSARHSISVLSLSTVGIIAAEGVRHLAEPGEVASRTVMAVAAAGIAVNAATAFLFVSGRKRDINLRATFLHMAYDALVAVSVLVAGGVIMLTGWTRLDPLTSLAIAAVILIGSRQLLRDTVSMALDAVPATIRLDEVAAFLKSNQASPQFTICTSGR
jgi:cobalt-zinc-cadmium efflux system protein